jgi:elongation factor Tu
MNKVDLVDDPELLELVEMEIRDLLTFMVSMVIILLSLKVLLQVLGWEEKWVKAVEELMDAVDDYIPLPPVPLISHS